MEGIQVRAYLLAAVIGAVGIAAAVFGRTATSKRTDETFMEERAPRIIPGYRMNPAVDGSVRHTYKMDDGTYKALHPFGIVACQFANAVNTFDAVLISSDSHESFHDPQLCFSAQDWTLGDARIENIDIPGRGVIPFTVVQMKGPRTSSIAAYCYKGPRGFVANPRRLQLDMFAEVLVGRKPMDSTFYRFMPVNSGVDFEQLKEFIKAYMSVASEESGGYF